MGVPKIGVPPNHLFGIVPYKPTIWGYPHLWKHPHFSAQKSVQNRQGWCCAPRGSVAHSSPCFWACGMQRPGLFWDLNWVFWGFNGNPTWGKQPTKIIGRITLQYKSITILLGLYFSASCFSCCHDRWNTRGCVWWWVFYLIDGHGDR